VVHFYHDDAGDVFARITESASEATWTIRNAFQLRMMIAGSNPSEEAQPASRRLKL
jgi:hypothetical protein